MTNHIEQIDKKARRYKNDLLMRKSYTFEPLETTELGELKISDSYIELSDETGVCSKTFIGHLEPVICLQYDKKLSRIFSSSSDGKINIWPLSDPVGPNEDTSDTLCTSLEEHKSCVSSLLLLPEENRLISGSWDSSIKIWDLNSLKCVNTFDKKVGVNCLCLLENKNELACGKIDGQIDVFDLVTFKDAYSIPAHVELVTRLVKLTNNRLASR